MTVDDFELFSARLVELGELFDAKLSESKQLLYFQALQDLPIGAVLESLVLAARSCTFFPKPAELRALVVEDNDDATESAWQDYKRLARQLGGYRSPVFKDPALSDALVAIFGSWEGACWTDLSPEMQVAKRKEFGRVYRVMRNRSQDGPKRLPGFIERENAIKGYVSAELEITDGPNRDRSLLGEGQADK